MKKERIVNFVLENYGSVCGIADLSVYKNDFVNSLIKKGITRGIVIGYRLSKSIFNELLDHPTPEYYHHYRQVNLFLDQLALKLTSFIQKEGYNAFPIPASQIIDWANQKAVLSHKHLGVIAGIGFIGRNNLLVNKDFGAQLRLVSVLTDLPVEPDSPIDLDCGDCVKCISVCPANAINFKKEDFNHMLCFEKLKEFVKKKYAGQYICGICVKICDGSNFK